MTLFGVQISSPRAKIEKLENSPKMIESKTPKRLNLENSVVQVEFGSFEIFSSKKLSV